MVFLVQFVVMINFLSIPWVLIQLIESDDQSDPFYVSLFALLSFSLFIGSWIRNLVTINVFLSSALNLWIAMLRGVVGAKSVFFD